MALYTRQKLNIRITANFLLALAANLPPTKPHVRRYFCAAVQLPSDWLEIVRIYSTVSHNDYLLYGLDDLDVPSLSSHYNLMFPVLQPLSADVPEEGDG